MMPDIAVLDPDVTLLPKKLTAATGVDAFVHNLEAYIMNVYHPIADAIAKEGIYKCFKMLQRMPLKMGMTLLLEVKCY